MKVFVPGRKLSCDEFISVPVNYLAAIYMALVWGVLVLGWSHPSPKHWNEMAS